MTLQSATGRVVSRNASKEAPACSLMPTSFVPPSWFGGRPLELISRSGSLPACGRVSYGAIRRCRERGVECRPPDPDPRRTASGAARRSTTHSMDLGLARRSLPQDGQGVVVETVRSDATASGQLQAFVHSKTLGRPDSGHLRCPLGVPLRSGAKDIAWGFCSWQEVAQNNSEWGRLENMSIWRYMRRHRTEEPPRDAP